jgi:hypothetical protein
MHYLKFFRKLNQFGQSSKTNVCARRHKLCTATCYIASKHIVTYLEVLRGRGWGLYLCETWRLVVCSSYFEGTVFLRNVGKRLPNEAASCFKRGLILKGIVLVIPYILPVTCWLWYAILCFPLLSAAYTQCTAHDGPYVLFSFAYLTREPLFCATMPCLYFLYKRLCYKIPLPER